MVNPANLAMFIAIFFAVIPTMWVLYRILERFQGFFDEKRLFKYLMVGMVAGGVVTLIEILLLRFHEPLLLDRFSVRQGVLVLVATYPLVEAAAKVVVLNWHTLARRPDTPYYGVSFGLGFGAVLTFLLVARVYAGLLGSPELALLSHFDIAAFSLFLFVLFVGGILIHAASGIAIGKATSDGDPLRALGYGTALTIPFYLGYFVVFRVGGVLLQALAAAGVFAFGVWAVRRGRTKVLEAIVPEDLARQVRRDMRRRLRGEDVNEEA